MTTLFVSRKFNVATGDTCRVEAYPMNISFPVPSIPNRTIRKLLGFSPAKLKEMDQQSSVRQALEPLLFGISSAVPPSEILVDRSMAKKILGISDASFNQIEHTLCGQLPGYYSLAQLGEWIELRTEQIVKEEFNRSRAARYVTRCISTGKQARRGFAKIIGHPLDSETSLHATERCL